MVRCGAGRSEYTIVARDMHIFHGIEDLIFHFAQVHTGSTGVRELVRI